MAFWSGETLVARGQNLIVPFSDKQIDCNAYTLRMGGQYYKTADHEQRSSEIQKRHLLKEHESLLIPSGQFALLLTKETVMVPKNAMAFISMRTGIKFDGLINVSGFHVDPGYTGQLVYAVYNASPSSIQICENDLIFKIWFCDMDQSSAEKYIKGPDDGLHEITNGMVRGMNRETISLHYLSEQINSVKFSMRVQAAIFGFASAVLAALLITAANFFLEHGLKTIFEHKETVASSAVTLQPTVPQATATKSRVSPGNSSK